MIRRRKTKQCPPPPIWLTTFADMTSLLLTVFILIFAMSSISKERLIEYLQVLRLMWGVHPNKEYKTPTVQKTSIKPPIKLYPKPEKWSEAENAAAESVKVFEKFGIPVKVLKKTKELVIRIPTDNLFKEGSYIPEKNYLPLLKKVCLILKKLNMPIKIEGHTDSRPIYRYPLIVDNWDLSLLRALYIAKYFIEWGFPEDKISLAGYADTEPIAPNTTPSGRAKNRRVDIVILVGSENI